VLNNAFIYLQPSRSLRNFRKCKTSGLTMAPRSSVSHSPTLRLTLPGSELWITIQRYKLRVDLLLKRLCCYSRRWRKMMQGCTDVLRPMNSELRHKMSALLSKDQQVSDPCEFLRFVTSYCHIFMIDMTMGWQEKEDKILWCFHF